MLMFTVYINVMIYALMMLNFVLQRTEAGKVETHSVSKSLTSDLIS